MRNRLLVFATLLTSSYLLSNFPAYGFEVSSKNDITENAGRSIESILLGGPIGLQKDFVAADLASFGAVIRFSSVFTGSPALTCNGVYQSCIRISGAPNMEFYIVKKTTFTKWATDNGKRGFDAGRGIDKLKFYGKNLFVVSGSGKSFKRLGQYDRPYWVIPVCETPIGPKIRWQTRKEIQMYELSESRENIECEI